MTRANAYTWHGLAWFPSISLLFLARDVCGVNKYKGPIEVEPSNPHVFPRERLRAVGGNSRDLPNSATLCLSRHPSFRLPGPRQMLPVLNFRRSRASRTRCVQSVLSVVFGQCHRKGAGGWKSKHSAACRKYANGQAITTYAVAPYEK